MDGLLLVDKPKGITSFDVIRRLRRSIGVWKMGHAGTLDPLASGLMLVGVGKGTKELAKLIKLDKEYEAEIVLGERRCTGDFESAILEEADASGVQEDTIERALASLVGAPELPVPAYSAIKQGGKPLYQLARKGREVAAPVRPMHVHEAQLLRTEARGPRMHVFVTFSVGSGTYIRSLAEELGRRLGYPATLGNLRRTRIGEFKVEDARSIGK
jgi:tRNA pseudouridine55 synthase